MTSGPIPIAASETFIAEHFIERRLRTNNSTSIAIKYGGSNRVAFGTGEYSTLDSDGRLPQNKVGWLSGVMIAVDYAVDATPEGEALTQFRAIYEMLNRCRVRIYVGTVLVAEHPMRLLTSPPLWIQAGTMTAGQLWDVQPGGWPVTFGEHPIVERQQLWIDIDNMTAVTAIDSASIWVQAMWQVKTRTMNVGRA